MFVLSARSTLNNISCAVTNLTENIRDILKNKWNKNQETCYIRIVNNRQPFCGHMEIKNPNLYILLKSLHGTNQSFCNKTPDKLNDK